MLNGEFPRERNFDGSIRAILSHLATNFITFGHHSAKMSPPNI